MEELIEALKTQRNLCDIAILVCEANKGELLPTILEVMLVEMQKPIFENCVEGEINE